MSVSNCCISQGSVATYLRCGENYYKRFVGNFFLFTAVQEFLKSVKIWQSYRQSSGPQFFFGTQGISSSTVAAPSESGLEREISLVLVVSALSKPSSNDFDLWTFCTHSHSHTWGVGQTWWLWLRFLSCWRAEEKRTEAEDFTQTARGTLRVSSPRNWHYEPATVKSN